MGRKHKRIPRLTFALSLGAAAMVAIAMLATEANAQAAEEELPQLSAVIEPLRPGVTESQVFAELAAHNEQRRSALHDYSVLRTYQVIDLKGKVHAEEVGRMEFLAPDKKTFTVDFRVWLRLGSKYGAESADKERDRNGSRQRTS